MNITPALFHRVVPAALALGAGSAWGMSSPQSLLAALDRATLGHPPECRVDATIRRIAAETADPAETTRGIYRFLRHSPMCYAPNLPPDVLERVLRRKALPPTMGMPPDADFFVDPRSWFGDPATGQIGQGISGRAQPARLTYSFPSDGTPWGFEIEGIPGPSPNLLNEKLVETFGPGNLDLGREHFRQALAAWRKYTGLRYEEVCDDDTPMDQSPTRVPERGDIRIGGFELGFATGILAYNAFPSPVFAGFGGGDMAMNTSFFIPTVYGDPTNNYRWLRNVAAHEHGHGTGNIHTVPCNQTKLMEPFASNAYETLQVDEWRGGQRNYGDRFAGNNSAANATELGAVTARAVRELSLSTNGVNGFNNSDEDWFTFTLAGVQQVSILVTPTGGAYSNGQQAFGCSGSTNTVVATLAGNLTLELRNNSGNTVLFSSANPAGLPESINENLLPGRYWIRVVDVGPNAADNQIVQLYDLDVRTPGTQAAPWAVAGIDKIVKVGQECFFIGDINSEATEPGVSIVRYDWDLDGNGTFETLSNPKPSRVYQTPGIVNVTLRVTDSNGQQDTDTIRVRVGCNPDGCYGNCDGSTVIPFLSPTDFSCFLERFRSSDPRANCDRSTVVPVLSPADFICFLQRYRQGC